MSEHFTGENNNGRIKGTTSRCWAQAGPARRVGLRALQNPHEAYLCRARTKPLRRSRRLGVHALRTIPVRLQTQLAHMGRIPPEAHLTNARPRFNSRDIVMRVGVFSFYVNFCSNISNTPSTFSKTSLFQNRITWIPIVFKYLVRIKSYA